MRIEITNREGKMVYKKTIIDTKEQRLIDFLIQTVELWKPTK